MKQHASLLFLIFTILFISGQCTHFRGGTISWSLPDASRTVTFTISTFWKLGSELIPSSIVLNLGDGNTRTFPLTTTTSNSEFATLSSVVTYTYAATGRYVVAGSECCRTSGLRVGAKTPLSVASHTNASTLPWKLTTVVFVRGVYEQSPSLNIPPVVDFGVGPNTLTITTNVPATLSFSLPTESNLGYQSLPSAFLFSSVNPRFISDPSDPNVKILSWNTDVADVGLWATQIKATSSSGHAVADFLIRVNNVKTESNQPLVILPPKPYFGKTLGETVTFKIGCTSEAGGSFTLTTPHIFPGMTINGGTTSSLTLNANEAVDVVFTPTITNGAKNQQYLLTFTCQSVSTSLSTTRSVFVSVGSPLILTPPPPAVLPCYPRCGCVEVGTATATDGCCGGPAVTFEDSVSVGSCDVKFNRTWIATNKCGQSAKHVQEIWVNDITPPVFISMPASQSVQCYWETDEGYFDVPFAKDTCGDTHLEVSTSQTVEGSSCKNVVTRTFTAVDDCGNPTEATQTLIVDDTLAPEITLATEAPLSVKCASQKGFFDGIASARDDCLGEVKFTWTDSANITCGKFTRTFTAEDVCGNNASKDFEVEIVHTEAPTITLPKHYDTPKCQADVFHIPPATAVTFCGSESAPELNGPTFTEEDKCYTSAVRVWSVTDECGIETKVEETISIVDKVRPTIHVPEDYTIECVYDESSQPYRPENTGGYATGTDNCGENVTITYKDETQTHQCYFYIYRTWTATDTCGNTASKTQTILVQDTTPPQFTAPTAFNGKCDHDLPNSGDIDYTHVKDCHPPQVSKEDKITHLGGEKCKNRIIIRKWHVHDQCGNKAEQEQVIKIEDYTPPTVTLPGDTTIECESSPNDPKDLGEADGKDECDEKIKLTITWVDDINPDGSGRKRVWTVSDTCGNTRNETQIINHNNSMPFLNCPSNVTVPCRDSSFPNITGYATASDKCTGTLKPTFKDTEAGTCPTVITRTWTVEDLTTRQKESCVQLITIDRPEGPTLKPHEDVNVQCEIDAVTFTTTGGACSTPTCPEHEVTKPTYRDHYNGNKCQAGRQLKRTWTTQDQCHRTSTAIQTINIFDTIKPTLEIPPDVERTCRFNLDAGRATSKDNCDAHPTITLNDNLRPSESYCPLEIVRTWTAIDCTGNSISKDQIIKINQPPPVWIGEPPKYLPPIQCPENFKVIPLQARDACGKILNGIPTVTKDGTCPTKYKISWIVTDSCGVSSTFEQFAEAKDTQIPVIDDKYIKDLSVECPSNIPVSGIVTVSDNCEGYLTPEFVDIVPPSNCTCEDCVGVVLRKWTAKDKCGNHAVPVIQKITTQKTNPPKLTKLKDFILTCGQPYTPDTTGTGLATATDSCGEKLLVHYKDEKIVGEHGSFVIIRTWSTADNCGNKDSHIQKITVDPRGGEVTVIPPEDCRLVCGGDKTVESCGTATVTSTCPDDKLTLVPSMEETCPLVPGVWNRKWEAYRNGVATGAYAIQRIYVEDCKPIGHGILNVPLAPVLLKSTYDLNAAIFITDQDLPCDVIKLVWTWGDGTSNLQICDPQAPTDRCIFGNGGLTATYPHTYISVGIKKITVLVTDQRSTDIQEDVDDGPTWGRFRAKLVLFPSNTGTVSGHIWIEIDREETKKRAISCDNSWVIAGPPTPAGDATKCSCDGSAFAMFQSTFTTKFGTIQASGDTDFEIAECCGGTIRFTAANISHLSIFDDGKSAVWTGFGAYPLLGLTDLPFTAFAFTSNSQKAFHLQVTDRAGNTIINTDPCYPPIVDWRSNPFTTKGLPNSKIVPSPPEDGQPGVDFSHFKVFNPNSFTLSALDDAQSTQRAQSGMIAAIVVGMIVFVVIVGVILFVALKRTGVKDNVFGQL